jgi:ATP-binding cassette subfamily B protein
MFDHLLNLPAAFFDRTRTGDIIARSTNDLTAVRMMFGPAIMYTMNAVALTPLAIAFMFSKNSVLALYALIPFPIIALIMHRLGKKIHMYFIKVQESYSDISAHVQENLDGIKVIKAYVTEDRELEQLKRLSLTYVDNNRSVIHLQSVMFPLLDVLASAGVIIVLWKGGNMVIAKETSLGVLVSLVMYIGLLVWPAVAFGWVIAIFQRGVASLHRIQEIFEEKPEPQGISSEINRLKGHITIQNLQFSFDDINTVLSGLSFKVKPGMKIAVVGRTGSGKSTLLGILTGNYQAQRECIFYDGVDINDIPLSTLRSSLAYIPQESFLFSDTIAENISFGKEGAGYDEIRRAAVLAAVADEIESFPKSYDTILGERGITVSGGQRQRITIARALISDAPIFFFDDSLSNVDTVTEKSILDIIKKKTADKTAIIVTQRLGAIQDCDEILYMKDGRIAERGTHVELMELNGEYAALYHEQESIESLENSNIK